MPRSAAPDAPPAVPGAAGAGDAVAGGASTAGAPSGSRPSLGQVLDFAWGRGPFTATEAMAGASLTRSTTIDAIDTLVEAGIVRELPNARDAGQYSGGRPARRFELPSDLGAVIAIDAGDTHLGVTVTDLARTPLAHRRTDLDRHHTVGQRRAVILQHLDAALTSSGVPRDRVLALCAGVAAPVARNGSSPPHPDGFWERTNPGLAELLAGWAPVVEIKNDAVLAAAAEGDLGEAVGCRDYIALVAGERFGAGAVVDGHILHGAHGGVGEMVLFDHVRGVDSADGLGPTITRIAGELLASGEAAADGALARLAAEGLTADRVLALAETGDVDAARVVRDTGAFLARVVAVLGSTYDPERVIICGAIAESIQPVLDAARDVLRPLLDLPAPAILRSKLGADIVLAGAVSTALAAARTAGLPQLVARRLQG
ncbi:Sugar kinase of the NBD/HSP70 family, may contain an N-terminal HTH domain [Microbacterium azadirachtae]|uniref:Sugar kinase of the NBD/HSP70 family, may contain an N-terminal HTH domain n=1 Tax=Microbacterium azadirachtae TaxID=582680 RepID=A0A1I6HUF4_9MICO|nr:Sugar kinase of the NBD/HSP70 family, may contain an N-terminal HTH domain [Microbacterium azadirachtae]